MKSERESQLAAVYAKTHRDYKGSIMGNRTIMVLRNGGSCLVKLEDLTDKEIQERL